MLLKILTRREVGGVLNLKVRDPGVLKAWDLNRHLNKYIMIYSSKGSLYFLFVKILLRDSSHRIVKSRVQNLKFYIFRIYLAAYMLRQ